MHAATVNQGGGGGVRRLAAEGGAKIHGVVVADIAVTVAICIGLFGVEVLRTVSHASPIPSSSVSC